MNKHEDGYDEAWFAALDAIVTGEEVSRAEDDDLLRLASKLSAALAPLHDARVFHDTPHPHPQDTPRGYPGVGRERRFGRGGRGWLRNVLVVAAAFIILFGVVSACPSSSQVSAATFNVGAQIWQAATSFDQIDASSVALLEVKQAEVRPLLTQALPLGAEALEFGIITNRNDPRSFRAFVANYRIAGQDLSLYEQPGDLVYPSMAAQIVLIGANKGQLFHDDAGNRILQWYQDGMTCSIASTLPVGELLSIARRFQLITNWDLFVG